MIEVHLQADMPWETYRHPDSDARGVWLGASDNGSSVTGASEGNFFWMAHDGAFASCFWRGGCLGSPVAGQYVNWGNKSYDFILQGNR